MANTKKSDMLGKRVAVVDGAVMVVDDAGELHPFDGVTSVDHEAGHAATEDSLGELPTLGFGVGLTYFETEYDAENRVFVISDILR